MVPVLTAAGDPQVAFTFADPRIDESSGLVSASRSDVVFTHNDSGDDARFFAVGPDGATRTTYVLPGVQARDWEDIARGPDERGRSSLWLGDIGDNNGLRENGILVHRVREPVPGASRSVTTEQPTSFRLRYPDGPQDAETLLVHPRTGRLLVVAKPFVGPASVFAAPERLDPDGPNQLTRIGAVDVDRTGTPGGPPGLGGLGQTLVTAGDIAPDGSRVAIRTYTDVYEWTVEGDDVAGALTGTPTVTALPATAQGEGLAYSADGRSLLTSTEGARAPVHRVTSRAAVSANSPPGRTPSSGSGETQSRPDEGGSIGIWSVAGSERQARLVAVAAAAGVLAGVVLLVRRHRRRRSR